ncbi:MAG: murein biosynthesis integral membrane protein MurJ [Candidatus Moranbacteria bacterium RIFOXYB1_FULL_43_19]|nr:MAG: murein biosynthesis integral membrane protein MurJ [Candidatus Moranbacteria bacterium RIFOXYA1_FULL_44_7]OGI27331.1 MAG: murein biosynthesis integral membrane protein MurJ [Candidatus Moranbacteria bacterium RIFOXYB1_FULL_43_19]OGI33835.1 MAG: murein biosynthesis integral membrane protein MurJ [Candidatus Moranbacteria bacterium RIFOXYC1_FULL_44_13]OGI38782.1 MAG: murein biosynthesis integral membrane protein MurJ [Candidatus Moranbacteria bacterium RIFOXYD1_FULL_44_12]
MIRKIVYKLKNSQPSNSINSAAFIIATAGILSRALGLVRDRILAANFGAGDTLDIYYASFRVPDLIYNLLILGALSAAFIPVFTSLLAHEKREEAWKLANGLLSLAFLVLFFISLVFAIFTPFFMKFITPGFSGEKLAAVVKLTRIMFLSPIFLGISGVFGGILNSFKRFLIYSLAPLFYNLGIILGVVFLVPIFGISGLAWGVAGGALLHMLVQYPAVKLSGFKFSPALNLRNGNLRKVLKLMIPRTMGLAVTQVNLLVVTIIASTLPAGSLAIFNFANNLQSFPIGVFAIPFALAVFPSLSYFAAKEEKGNFIDSFSRTFRQILYFAIPASVLILVLRAQIVRVILGSGNFDWEDTILTFQALGIFAVSLFAQCLVPLLARSFYALQNTKIPFYTGIVSEVVNLTLALVLSRLYGILGLAWAFSLSSMVNMFLLFLILRSKTGDLDDKKIISVTAKISLFALLAGGVAQLSKYIVGPYTDTETFLGIFTQLAAGGAVGLALFFVLSYAFRLEEFEAVKKLLSGKFLRQRQSIPDDPTEASGL